MTKPTFAFIALCIAAPALQLLEHYGLYHWEDGVVAGLLIAALVLLLTLFVWSVFSVRRHRVRAVAGALICAYCLWQAFQNGKIIY
jgi:uncharacterized BrkB/YihY/UPF0761 family membrane protein